MLSVVATPIGNLEDITLRAVRVLTEADVVVCEDTRETIKLLKHYKIPPKQLVSLYEENEQRKIDDILALLRDGKNLALVSDSGTPLVSDPGFKLVRQVLESGLKVQSIPGPSAVINALVISGFPPDKFLFLGFLPEKEGHRKKLLESLKKSQENLESTIIIYVSPYKLNRDLLTIEEIFGDIEVVLIREMTKIYEERWKGKISEAKTKFKNPRGEFVLLFHL